MEQPQQEIILNLQIFKLVSSSSDKQIAISIICLSDEGTLYKFEMFISDCCYFPFIFVYILLYFYVCS